MELSPSMQVEVASNSAAGFGHRLAARLIDLLFGGLFVYLGGEAGAFLPRAPWTVRSALTAVLLGALLSSITSETLGGATLGKWLLRLRVTSEDLTPCTFRGALLRNVSLCVDALGVPAYRAMARSLMSQRLGDQWGHTVVLLANAVPPDSRKSTGLLLLGLFSGSVLWGLCGALSVVLRAL